MDLPARSTARMGSAKRKRVEATPGPSDVESDLSTLTSERELPVIKVKNAANRGDVAPKKLSFANKTPDAAAKKRAPRKVTTAAQDDDDDTPKPKRKRTPKKPAVDDNGELIPTPKKGRKPRPPKPEPVYVIPDVEKKTTTFKGRLGYACLNTVLRNKKPATESVFCSRTCRVDSIKKNGMEWLKDLGRQNVTDLLTMIQWNEDNNIKFMRLSSEMFPFASHLEYGYSLSYCAPLLAQVGELANKYGHRLTVHPGQFNQLGSPNPKVVEATIRDLGYHAEMLDRMGIGKDGVMIIHGGGVYGDKSSTLKRIKKTIQDVLPQNIKDRLVLENDELCYNAEDLLPICEACQIPLVFDYHHDNLFPSPNLSPGQIILRANAIFKKRGIKPKQHLSEAREGAVTLMERRAHADRCTSLPPDLPDDMDLMIEAKDKEQAVFHLYRVYGLCPVIHANLRPPNPDQTKETKGRKSQKKRVKGGDGKEVSLTKKARKRRTKEVDADDSVEEDGDCSSCDDGGEYQSA